MALAAITIIAIDGSAEDEELATLHHRIVRGDDNVFDQALKVYKSKSLEECIQIVSRTLDQKQKLATMAVLLDIAMADGVLAGTEKTLILCYLNAFQFMESDIKDIVEVIAIKNDFSIFA